MSAASEAELNYYFGDNGTLEFDEFSTEISPFDIRRRNFVGFDRNEFLNFAHLFVSIRLCPIFST